MRSTRKILVFLAKVFLLILLFSILLPFIDEGYADLLSAASDVLAPSNIRITALDNIILINFRADLRPLALYSLPLQGGLVLITSLVMATPGLTVIQRVMCTVAAVVLTFALHVVTLVVIGLGMNLSRWALRPLAILFLSIGIDLFPVLIWTALSAKYWWPGSKARLSENGQTDKE
ncbi:hypothetical protein ACFLV6_00795 [Chloroflexota bacterium]